DMLVKTSPAINIQSSICKAAYIDAVNALKQHIKRGDCYEINFCQQFFAKDAVIDPLYTYSRLMELSPSPFASLYKLNDKYCLCASPERYLKKSGISILSQPIKGTSKRNNLDEMEDIASKNKLQSSSKERSENVMIVDLVRNDLSRICKEGSVQVEELFGIYSFPQVHQMISSIKGELREGLHWTDAIKATFPMGSMTGAPKKRVMELIDEYETTSRGLFSGSIGYINPDGDFDFNVVIRSIFYDETERNLSFSAGGGITFNSNAADEYEESMLKASVIIKVLEER
ncbi:MAG TPA: anthranilate synthase component I family protein, partial [Ferruginibacter sp.]|nr:anthranilate synthase component I family protein [Ferruginibacter sp.]